MSVSFVERFRDGIERLFPDREVYIRSHGAVRYVTLTSTVQALAAVAAVVVVLWSVAFTVQAFVSEGRVAYRDEAFASVQEQYEARLARMQDRYDRLEAELFDSERRFDDVMAQLSGQTGRLESDVGVELALQGRLEAARRRLAELTEQRDEALTSLEDLRFRSMDMERRLSNAHREARQGRENLDDFVGALDATVRERDDARGSVRRLAGEVDQLNEAIEEIRRHQTQVMVQLEEATQASVGELERILGETGVDLDGLIEEIRQTYRGEGGPFIPIVYRLPDAARGFPLNEGRVSELLDGLQRVNSLRIALERLPLVRPIQASFRMTSGFGARRHPVTGRWAMHHGLDMAAPKGTPIFAPAGGVVRFAGVQRGYGKVVIVQHSLGYETRYGHLNKILVGEGDTVTQNQHIADVGNTGRSTGPHLHYEIRRYDDPLNPWRFIEAGRNVF